MNIEMDPAEIKKISWAPFSSKMDPSGLSNGSCYHDTRIRTRGLRLSCSRRHKSIGFKACKGGALPLSYGPIIFRIYPDLCTEYIMIIFLI